VGDARARADRADPPVDRVAADEREAIAVVLDQARRGRVELGATAAEPAPAAALVGVDRADQGLGAVIDEVAAGELDDAGVERVERSRRTAG